MSLRNGIILHGKKLVFWYVPKNACTSIKKLLADAQGLQYSNPHDAPFDLASPDQAHQFDGYTQVAIVRNPFDRLVSCYRDKIRPGVRDRGFPQGVEYTMTSYGFHELMTFGAFANRIFTHPIDNPHWVAQTKLLPENKYLQIVKFEEMGKALPEILFRHGIGGDLPHYNRSKRRGPYAELFDERLRAMAIDYYLDDLTNYDYAF